MKDVPPVKYLAVRAWAKSCGDQKWGGEDELRVGDADVTRWPTVMSLLPDGLLGEGVQYLDAD